MKNPFYIRPVEKPLVNPIHENQLIRTQMESNPHFKKNSMATALMSNNSPGPTITLERLVHALINVKLESVVRKQSFFINEIQRNVPLMADRSVVTNVLDSLLQNVLSETNSSCIRISAKEYSQVLLIHIYDNHEADHAVKNVISELVRVEAKKIGGYVGITRHQKNQTVIAFSFPNVPMAA